MALNVLEVPLDRPLDADLDELEDAANRELDEAIAIGDSYGVRVLDRLVARAQRGRRDRGGGGAARHGDHRHRDAAEAPDAAATRGVRHTVDYVLRHAPCRVLVTASREAVPRVIWYRRAIYVFSVVFVVIGLALLVITAINGGGLVGFVLGALFIALGVGRLQLERKRGA